VQSVSIVVPTFNERENLPELVGRIHRALGERPHEILIIDDCSPDGTAEAARSLGAQFPMLKVLTPERREGLGAALRFGFDKAVHDILVSSDADLSFAPEDIPRLLREIDEGADLALGSRHAVEGVYTAATWSVGVKRWVSMAGNAVVPWLMGLPVRDCSANFRALRRSVWHSLELTDTSNSMLLEMIAAAHGQGRLISEVPVTFGPRRAGISKIRLTRELPRYFVRLLQHFYHYRLG
jgi:dolichol-phosphate mannosyltransferase